MDKYIYIYIQYISVSSIAGKTLNTYFGFPGHPLDDLAFSLSLYIYIYIERERAIEI